MVAIRTVDACPHAAALVKGREIYLLLLFSPLFADSPGWHLTLMAVGLSTSVFGAYQALKQNDMKALLAYATVSQLGVLVMLLAFQGEEAYIAVAVGILAHALYKGPLFMVAGIIDHATGTRDLRRLAGLARPLLWVTVTATLAGLSLAGIPPTFGFVAKEEAFYAFLGTGQAEWAQGGSWLGVIAAGVAVIGAAMTFAYSARIIAGTFAGPLLQTNLYEPAALFLAPAAVPAVLGLILGLVPFVLNDLVTRAVVDTGFTETEAGLALWHGFTPALGLSATAIGLGIFLHLRRSKPGRLGGVGGPGHARPRRLRSRVWTPR